MNNCWKILLKYHRENLQIAIAIKFLKYSRHSGYIEGLSCDQFHFHFSSKIFIFLVWFGLFFQDQQYIFFVNILSMTEGNHQEWWSFYPWAYKLAIFRCIEMNFKKKVIALLSFYRMMLRSVSEGMKNRIIIVNKSNISLE